MSDLNVEQQQRHSDFVAALNALQQRYGVYITAHVKPRPLGPVLQVEATIGYSVTEQAPMSMEIVDADEVPQHVIEAERNGRGEG